MIALGFLSIIIVGTILLMLPISAKSGNHTDFVDCLFTATSATCVTGLIPFDTYTHWTGFGQFVIIALIQIGGLGLMSLITLFSAFMRRHITLSERRIIMESSGATVSHAVPLLKRIIRGTLMFETAGALLMSIRYIPRLGLGKGIWFSVFHSISAFCNAGFDLMGKWQPLSSFTKDADDPIFTFTICGLIIIGGLGFVVWNDIRENKFHFRRYALHSKLVLISTGILVFGGTAFFFITEKNFACKDMGIGERLLTAFFQSVTPRTAGFNSIHESRLSDPGKLLTIIYMFIGGSPASTAGGIKTTTLAVLLLEVFSCARGNDHLNVFKKQIEYRIVRQANAIFFIYLAMTIVAVMLISAVEPFHLVEIIFEATSAIGTVGLTMGITGQLSAFSKIVLTILMYAGRNGGFTLLVALAEKKQGFPLERPTEKILVG